MAGIAEFLAGAVSSGAEEYTRQRGQLRKDEREKKRHYIQLIMTGDWTEEEARSISGYMGTTGEEGKAVESRMKRRGEEAERERQLGIETAAAKKFPIEYLGHQESPYFLKKTMKGAMGTPLAIPTEESFPERIQRKRALGAEEELRQGKGKRTFEMEKITTRHDLAKKLALYKSGLDAKGKTEKPDPIETKWMATVDAIVRYNETHPDLEYPVTAPSLEEYRSHYRKGGYSKAEALVVFRDMKAAGMSQEDMLDMYNKNQSQLLIDGVDLASLMEKIMGRKKK